MVHKTGDYIHSQREFSTKSTSYKMGHEHGYEGKEYRPPNKGNHLASLDYDAGYNHGRDKRKSEMKEETIVENDTDANGDAVTSVLDNNGNIETKVVTTGEVTDGPGFDAMKAVNHALNGQALDFEREISLGLAARVQDAVERKRDEVAQAIFGTQDQEVDTEDNDAVEEPVSDEVVDSQETEEEEDTPTEE